MTRRMLRAAAVVALAAAVATGTAGVFGQLVRAPSG